MRLYKLLFYPFPILCAPEKWNPYKSKNFEFVPTFKAKRTFVELSLFGIQNFPVTIFLAIFGKSLDDDQSQDGFVFIFARTIFAPSLVFRVEYLYDFPLNLAVAFKNFNDRKKFTRCIVNCLPFSENAAVLGSGKSHHKKQGKATEISFHIVIISPDGSGILFWRIFSAKKDIANSRKKLLTFIKWTAIRILFSFLICWWNHLNRTPKAKSCNWSKYRTSWSIRYRSIRTIRCILKTEWPKSRNHKTIK